ncbi:MAG: tRNA preQ1(34) S-adenosylmethionine ribosyltransferase-isomerase QueA [Chloroflexota bacterium]|nr:tRNA preQ1(34) S-adenosylmethionine ribosyltransferase-isomerase QueA [Chloroflexota bacterium]
MTLDTYDYELPAHLIAQTPAAHRDASRLMVLSRRHGTRTHRTFRNLPEFLRPDDVLVFNDTRVLHARMHARREESGGRVELLLLRPCGAGVWEAMARPARRLVPGEKLRLKSGAIVSFTDRTVQGTVMIALPPEVERNLTSHAELPLPPYIRDFTGDPGRYQTVYARHDGSVAAPTAGLHFTQGLVEELRVMGVLIRYVTLHVGPGTFKPVQAQRLEDHVMHAERYLVPESLPGELRTIRERGGRVVAVGTTSARSLEAVAAQPESAGRWGETDLYIRPGYEWRIVDGLITNFHLPRSTLLMLVASLAEKNDWRTAYEEAIEQRYRFYSFGDAMLIL